MNKRSIFIIAYCIVVTILGACLAGICIWATLEGHNDGDWLVWTITSIFGLCAIGFGTLAFKLIKQGGI